MRPAALAIALVGLCLACNPFRNGSISGRLESTGEAGNWVLEEGTCYSGQREQYHGVIGIGPDGTGIAVKLVKDSIRGWTAVINQADTCKSLVEKSACKAVVLTPSNCTTLDVDLSPTNTTINDIRVVDATLRIDCEHGGSRIKGNLVFERCH